MVNRNPQMTNMTIDIEASLKKVNEYIDQIDVLQHESHTEGKKKLGELNASIKNFIRIAFQDGEKKLSDYKGSFPMYVGILGREDTEEEKQEYYLKTLSSIKNNLIAYQQELQLRLESKKKRSKLDKIEKETKISEAEAKRRASVVETKLWGAVIELIDMQRNELKKRGKLTQEIIGLRTELGELRLMLVEFLKKADK